MNTNMTKAMKTMTATRALLTMLLAACAAASGCVEVVDAQTPSASGNCVARAPEAATAQSMIEELAPAPAYLIGKQDTLQINVSPEASLNDSQKCSRAYTVQSDGTISNFCSLPSVKAEGMTVQMLTEDLKDKLIKSGQYTSVVVDVEIKDFRSQSVYVQGPVRTPGTVQLRGNQLSLMNAINQAGGWAPEAGTEVYLLRPPANTTTITTMEDPRALKTRYLRKELMANKVDPQIQAGDTIFVTQAEVFWINGEVRSGGQKIFEECMTLYEAISMAGGVTERGSLGRSYIMRKNAKGELVRQKDLKNETRIQPRDTIQIERKLF
jgi:polysaccharide export outer membrane protein